MSRVVSLFLPTRSTDRWRRKHGSPPPDTPLVMVGREGNRRVVVAVDAAARVARVGVGTPATKAQALVPGLVIQNADPDDDGKALERLAAWALRYSPIAAAAAPDGILIDTTGADHLHGGEGPMLSDVISRRRQAGFQVRGAISDTWGTSPA